MSSNGTDVAVVGSGPYGLSIASHLRKRHIAYRIFGPPMQTWLRMPATLNLKSFGFATNIYVPRAGFSFPEYCKARGLEHFEPCTMASFADYGVWVQKQLLPEVEPVLVTGIRADGGGGEFEVTLSTGERVRAKRIVIAVGVQHFVRMPDFLAGLPRELASHTLMHSDYTAFKGKEVAVIGAGSSALESATLLHEAGARPRLLVRGPGVTFHTRFNPKRSLLERIRDPISVLGPGRKSWLLENVPMAARYLPEARRIRFTKTYLGPAGSWWLRDRFEGKVPVQTRCCVLAADDRGGRVHLRLREDGKRDSSLEVDHVVAGTGFEVDLDRLSFIDKGLRDRIRRIERAPSLSRHFESSVPGVYFVGLAAALSFGPLLRFVCGAAFATPTIVRHLGAAQRRGVATRV